jgi:hypothetical protein
MLTEMQARLDQLCVSSDHIQAATDKVQTFQHQLISQSVSQDSAKLRYTQEEACRVISSRLAKHFEPPRTEQAGPPKDRNENRMGRRTKPIVNSRSSGQSHIEDGPVLGPWTSSNVLNEGWIKTKTSKGFWQTVFRNNLFGTMSVRTVTSTYVHKGATEHAAVKNVTSSTLVFLPAPWLSRRGAIFRHQNTEFSNPAQRSSPHWGLSTVNIVPGDSDIVRACVTHDLSTIRRLFDEHLASPYDVDRWGRNLLSIVAFGVYVRFVPSLFIVALNLNHGRSTRSLLESTRAFSNESMMWKPF